MRLGLLTDIHEQVDLLHIPWDGLGPPIHLRCPVLCTIAPRPGGRCPMRPNHDDQLILRE